MAGCKSISTSNSRCALHQPQPKQPQLPQPKVVNTRSSTTENNHIYHSTKWRKLRARKFKMNPICEHCLKFNIIKPTDVIDHIVAIIDDDTLAYVFKNLQGLCARCHNTKTAKETADRNIPKVLTSSELFNQLKTQLKRNTNDKP